MIPVPSYELIPFLAWLSQRGFRLSTERSPELRHLALEFLQHRGYCDFDSLAGVMVIFQECPMIAEPDIEAQMKHFAGCGRCMEYIREGGRMGPRRGRTPVYREPEQNEGVLHPLLQGFTRWAQGSELEMRLRGMHYPGLNRSESSPNEFARLMRRIGDELRELFHQYLAETRERAPEVIEHYVRWRREREGREPPLLEGRHRVEESTQPLGPNESIEEAAQRLSESVRLAIGSGFYDQRLAEEPRFALLMSSLAMDTPENLAQTLAFLSWMRGREPGLAVTGNIPAAELEVLALQFCEERGYSNARSFSKEAKRWLSGAGSPRVVDRIATFLGLGRRAKPPDGRMTSDNPLDRYASVRFHGLFLFLSSGDFPTFIDAHWRDLHHLTGDDLDVYFSQKDLSERTSGYKLAARLKDVPLRVDALPALLLWEDRLETSVTVPLQGLKHGDVVEVMKTIVQGIRDGCTLRTIAERGAASAVEFRAKAERGVVVQSGASLLIYNGGVMGDIYRNEGGVVGAMGPGAVVHDNVFHQDARKLLSTVTLSAQDAPAITKLAEAIAGRQVEGVSLAERMDGARHLASLAEAAQAGTEQAESVAGWRQWLASLGERSQKVLAVVADVTTLAAPVAKLLGLSP